MRDGREERRGVATVSAPEATGAAAAWLALSDDDLLFEIERLPAAHAMDVALLAVVRSDRHFFIRQEAAKRVRDHERLKEYSTDRHIGQILVRNLHRADDVAFLERLLVESRHVEVQKAAEAQLACIARGKPKKTGF